MTSNSPRIIRDPIHDLILFEDTKCDKLLLDLINTREFQRLRRVKQLGFSDMVYPGANHSRFAHSIGVMQMGRRFLRGLEKRYPNLLSDEGRTVVLAACLLHDVGHGPFSHAFEQVTGDNHEKRTSEIISTDGTEVHSLLSAFDSDLPEALGKFFLGGVLDATKWGVPASLSNIVSSQLDADRFDYLLRDCYSTGTSYGQFDAGWLIEHLHIHENSQKFYLDSKGLEAAEMYVYARYHMYHAVYFHKTTRAAEVMVRLLFDRFKDLIADAKQAGLDVAEVVPGATKSLLGAFSHQEIALDDYLELDDGSVVEFLKLCRSAEDSVLRELATGLIQRKLWKPFDVSEYVRSQDLRLWDIKPRVSDMFAGQNMIPKFLFAEDRPADTPYKVYGGKGIHFKKKSGEVVEISTVSDPIKALTAKVESLRYYCPDRFRREIETVIRETLS